MNTKLVLMAAVFDVLAALLTALVAGLRWVWRGWDFAINQVASHTCSTRARG